MKLKKLKNHSIYRIVDQANYCEFYVNFKPTSKELTELCCREFCWSEDEYQVCKTLLTLRKVDILCKAAVK